MLSVQPNILLIKMKTKEHATATREKFSQITADNVVQIRWKLELHLANWKHWSMKMIGKKLDGQYSTPCKLTMSKVPGGHCPDGQSTWWAFFLIGILPDGHSFMYLYSKAKGSYPEFSFHLIRLVFAGTDVKYLSMKKFQNKIFSTFDFNIWSKTQLINRFSYNYINFMTSYTYFILICGGRRVAGKGFSGLYLGNRKV